MEGTMKWIGSGTTHYQMGMFFGIAITIISLLGSAKYPFFQPLFDWMLVFFVGLFVFFFFMGIRFNTEENSDVKIEEDHNTGQKNKKTFTSYQIYLNKFNVLSKACFVFAGIFGVLVLFRLLAIAIFS